ncbi:AAA family ATPase [Vibrio diabolicus]|uniref:AAA family ATPase n=1 Tax=Vibrio diabolicus TaxID=50719 RepID=UPI0024944CDC|nr:AAA family ATPase [Vibrio diabolicus]
MTTENKQNRIKKQKELWDAFLKRWPIEKLKELTLEQYVSTDDQDTFTYWLETKTRELGSIKGNTSAKFGIYKRSGVAKKQNGIEHGDVYSWRTRYGQTQEEVFKSVITKLVGVVDAAQRGDLNAIDKVDFSPMVKWKLAFLYQNREHPVLINTFSKNMLEVLTDSDHKASYPSMYSKLIQQKGNKDLLEFGLESWESFKQNQKEIGQLPLNQILYGPPGTGKTYHTIEAAVNAAEPEFVWDTREELKAEYDRLVSEQRIRFVTFHQSYGYEEFVEGLTAEATEDKQIAYRVKDGVFKTICDDASVSEKQVSSQIKSSGRVWKLSIEGTHKNEAKTYCFEHNMGAIGWCETGDLSNGDKNDYFLKRGQNDQNSLLYFSNEMTKGDLVLCIDSAKSVEAVGVVIGDYQYIESGVPSRDDFCHQRSIKWLAKGFSVDFKSINGNKQFSQPTCYPLWRLSVNDVLSHLQSYDVDIHEFDDENNTQPKNNYVLVIDEINRGNISKIFGELITLIEPSKRKGASEALELVLPNSGKPFSVPDNLFLIGTMNTADRSLAMMDTALRRRFDFVEMMPKPEVFEDTSKLQGINLQKLLQVLNQRIEILYDREHTLGHAFFMPVKELVDAGEEEQAFSALVSVFQNKIIPLLEEYFFEDWSKIRLVLADNQAKPQELQFVSEQVQNTQQLNDLFGNNHELEQYGQSITKYTLADKEADIWNKPESYIGIYTTLVSSAE